VKKTSPKITMIISMKVAVITSMIAGVSEAFTPPSISKNCVYVGSSCSLHLQATPEQDHDANRRQVLQQTFTAAVSSLLLPQWANADGEATVKPAVPVVVSTSSSTSPVVEKKDVVVAKSENPVVASSTSSSAPTVLKADASMTTQPSISKSTPKYEKEIVTSDPTSGASSSSTAVSSSDAPVKVKEDVKVSQQPAPAPAVVSPPKPLTKESYALSIQQSTSALTTKLSHAFLVVDGLNTQARRLSTSSGSDHRVAVLEGMNTQTKRLQEDLTSASDLYKLIIGQAKLITVPEESFETTVAEVTRASSVLDGLLVQSKRLVTASKVAAGGSTDDQIMYMLSVLDGLNTQVKRLNVKQTFGMLDKLNSQAAKAN
jgi:hypothetical protein